MSDPSCREIRHLLGVYVVGAIDPADRAVVDRHLDRCADCREELAGLAALPALLGRVPLADAERLTLAGDSQAEDALPSAELLPSLLRRAAARRKISRWRAIAAEGQPQQVRNYFPSLPTTRDKWTIKQCRALSGFGRSFSAR